MNHFYNVSAAPHIRSPITTKSIMQDVVIALIPASLFGIFNFGLRALLVILATVLSCVLTEYIYCRLMKILYPVDYSDVVTGLLLALNLPVYPYLDCCVGRRICYINSKNAFWWFRPKLYESGSKSISINQLPY